MIRENTELVILIAHYNNLDGLKVSLMSIKEDFPIDIVIVDDGSQIIPNEAELANWYHHGAITLDLMPSNQGVGVAANRGLEIIKQKDYQFVGRLDCGDKCKPNKFKKQLSVLKNDPDLKFLGTWANMVDEKGKFLYVLTHPTSFEVIKKKMYINSQFINPTVVFKIEVLKKVPGYKYAYRYAAQDYAFFFDLIQFYKGENLAEALLDYELSPQSISSTKRKLQVKNRLKIILSHFKFRPYVIYSLIRNSILYFFPRETFNKFFKDKY